MSAVHSETLARPSPTEVAEAAVWRVRLLGGFEIDDGRHRLTRLRSRAAMALLAQLALAPERDHARETLAALLWPDADEVAGRNRLRQTLSLLKAVLEPPGGPPVLQADRRVVRAVAGALWCDARAFEQAQRAGHHAEAAALYGGELLPGFYDEWLLDERRRLQALHERVIERAPAPQARPAAAAATPASAPALATPAAPSRNALPRLPQYLTRLIGADVQGARLQAQVMEHRLVTVLGAGGCGKTRLATEVARLACTAPHGGAPHFEHAVFVSLVGATTATELLDRLRLALRIESAGPPLDSVLATLEGRRLLVLLDNAEQLHDDAAAAIARLAESLPAAHWLVTSRRPLGLDGERSFPLETLELPAPDAALDAVALNPAVALFVDRARAHRADFHVTAGQGHALVALVHWLEGLPLAIELAASHVRSLGPAELLALLQAARADRAAPAGSLAFLARRGVRSGSDPRHASMLDVVGWSWRLLDKPQQQMLAALCLLPVGAALPMAAALGGSVTGNAATSAAAALSLAQAQALLDELVSNSVLKTTTGQDGQRRYTPLEPVREYVLAQLDDTRLHTLRQRLLAWLMDWARDMPPTAPLPSVRDELPTLVQALVAAPADGAANDALRLVLWLQSSWGEITMPAGALDALDALLASPGLDDAHAAAGHAVAATFSYEAGRVERVRPHLLQAATLPCPDPALRVMVLSRSARLHWRLDRNAERARALVEEALPLARATGRSNSEASLLSLKGHMLTAGDGLPEQGRVYTEQSLALWQRSGNRHLINAGRYNVAVTALRAGRPASVLDELQALADEGRDLQDWDLASGALEAHGTALLALRRWPEAAQSLRASLTLAWDGMEMMAVMYALWNFAPVLARLRLAELAAMTMAAADAHWRERYGQRDASDLRELRRVRRFTRALLGPAAAQSAWARGAARSVGDTVRAVLESPAGR